MEYKHNKLFEGETPVYVSECGRYEVYDDEGLFDIFDKNLNQIRGGGELKNMAYTSLQDAIDAVNTMTEG